jgi:hypothetical protein
MRRLKSSSLAAVAALAVFAVVGAGVASASEPKLEPTSPATFPVSFTGHGGAGTLEATDGHQVAWSTSTAKMEISSATTFQNMEVTFTGSTAFFGFVSCNSLGQAAGVVKTNVLHGTLVYLETGSSKKGLLLKPAVGTTLLTMNCGGTTITVTGQMLGELVQVSHSQWTLHFRRLENRHPSPASYLANVGCTHTSTTESLKATGTGGFTPFASSPAGLSTTLTLTPSKGTALGGVGCV